MYLPQDYIDSIKMGLDLAATQQHAGSQYDVLVVVRDEVQRLINQCVKNMRVDLED